MTVRIFVAHLFLPVKKTKITWLWFDSINNILVCFFQPSSLTPEIVSTPSSPEEEEKSILNAPVLIDDSMPATKIQIRLADGSRLIQRFNQTHR